jgi:hypothetical protein
MRLSVVVAVAAAIATARARARDVASVNAEVVSPLDRGCDEARESAHGVSVHHSVVAPLGRAVTPGKCQVGYMLSSIGAFGSTRNQSSMAASSASGFVHRCTVTNRRAACKHVMASTTVM